MNTKIQSNIINYFVICINEFAERHNVESKAAYRYLAKFGGIRFLSEYYGVEHTLSLDDAVDDLERICENNGGNLHDILSRV